jgi:hypothetical protein
VRRRFLRLPVIQELREPLRKQIGIRYFGFRTRRTGVGADSDTSGTLQQWHRKDG